MPKMTKTLQQAFEAKLLEGALPGELEGFEDNERKEAAEFVAQAAATRPPAPTRWPNWPTTPPACWTNWPPGR
jgi:hypothetical protein